MNDFIERQAAIDLILEDKIGNKSLEIFSALGIANQAIAVNMACDRHIQGIKNLPSAQPEIIRCEDCKHSHADKLFTMLWCHGDIVDKNHFCSKAVRRTDENND